VAGACGGDDDDASSDTEAPDATDAPAGTDAPADTADTAAPSDTDAPADTAAPSDTTAPADTAAPAGDTPCLVSGDAATGEPIKVGSIQSKTGPDDFSSSGQGAKAFFECVNANGGINGRPVEFLLEDDQWTPETASQLGAKLVNDEAVVAMVGSSSFVECGVNEPLYEAEGVVAVYGTGVPRECFHSKNISATNAGPRISALGIAQYMVSEYGAETMTCISQNIPNTGEWVCTGLQEWGETAGVTVRTLLHDPANPDFISIIQDAVSDSPDAVIVMEPAGLTVPLLAVAEEQDLGDATHWGGPTSQYLAGFPETIGEYWWGRYDVQAELTTIDNTSPDNQAWLATMDEYGEADDPRDTFSQAGWLAAKIFTDTLLAMDPEAITREAVTEAIQNVKAYPSDLNCGDWYFGPGDRHNSNHAGRIVTINDAGEYELVQDCQEHADPELEDVLALEESEGLGG
jgi:branched-chain amino acid transport system substrate-binding protein